MIIQNNTVVISPGSSSSSPSSSPTASSSSSSADSDWQLEMKMETDDSPEPDLSPTQSSPELSSEEKSGTIILTPPVEFADSSLQSPHMHRTPASQVRNTPALLRNCGATFTIPGQISDSTQQGQRDSPIGLVSSALCDNSKEDVPACGTTTGIITPLGVTEPVLSTSSASVTNMSSLLYRGTPSIMATSSMMNSTFRVRSPSSAGMSATLEGTPCIIVTDSILGDSTFAVGSRSSMLRGDLSTFRRTPNSMIQDSPAGSIVLTTQSSVPQHSSDLTQKIPPGHSETSNASVKPLSPSKADSALVRPFPVTSSASSVTGTSTDVPFSNLSFEATVFHGNSAMTSITKVSYPPDVSQSQTSEQMMEATPSLTDTTNDLADCRARMDSIRSREHELKEELQGIKGQFFDLLDNLGFSHDLYYNAVTPAPTPHSVQLHYQKVKNPLASEEAFSSSQCHLQSQVNIDSGNSNTNRMSTPQGTPRRPSPRHPAGEVRSMYADLMINQLLARGYVDSDSSKSNSPPDIDDGDDQDEAAAQPDQPYSQLDAGVEQINSLDDAHEKYTMGESVSINSGKVDLHDKDGIKSKAVRTVDVPETREEFDSTFMAHQELAKHETLQSTHQLIVASQDPLPSNQNSKSVSLSKCSSSRNCSVPDLDKERASRMQYYSDFTIDRQKKIDEAGVMLETVEDSSNSPSTPSDHSSESISQRCVEGSENTPQFKRPLLPPVSTIKSTQTKATQKDGRNRSKSSRDSSGVSESDISSGTESVSHSQYSSRASSRHSFNHSSKNSRDRRSACSSSDRRSSSRGSRCTSHPLASSTFISDPSNIGSPDSGSVYTWSLENSSDENLHQSYLRSEKRQRRRSRPSHRRSSAHKSRHSQHSAAVCASQGPNRPATVIGADHRPLDRQLQPVGTTFHHNQMVLAVATPARKFGGTSYENNAQILPTPRSSSLPRTSTRIACREGARGHRTLSSPELSNPNCSELDCAISRICPPNPSGICQHMVSKGPSPPLLFRPELEGKSSSSGSGNSYLSQCLTCNPALAFSYASSHMKLVGQDHCDDILTNSAQSIDSGVQPPYNSYTSPVGSTNEYTTISDSSPESSIIVSSAPRQPRAFAVKSPTVFKVPFSPASRTVRRKMGAGGRSTHSVGVRAVGTPHLPVGLLKQKESVSRRKLFTGAPAQSANNSFHTPKIFDRKSLMRKIKKFSNNFKKDKDGAKIHTLANL